MAYVIVTTRPKELKGLLDQHSFLSESQWCTEGGILSTVLKALEGEFSFILVDFDGQDFFVDQLSQVKKREEFKLVYFCQEFNGSMLRDHQASDIGGDAYLPLSISSIDLEQMLLALTPQDMNVKGNRLESSTTDNILKKYDLHRLDALETWKKSFPSQSLDEIFESAIISKPKTKFQSVSSFAALPPEEGEDLVQDEVNISEDEVMSDKDQDLSLDDLGDLEIGGDETPALSDEIEEGGFDLNLDDSDGLSLSEEGDISDTAPADDSVDFNLDDELELTEDQDFSLSTEDSGDEDGLSLSDDGGDDLLSLGGDDEQGLSLAEDDTPPDLGSDESLDFSLGDGDEAFALDGEDTPSVPEEVSTDDSDLGELNLSADEDMDLSFSADDDSAPAVAESDLSADALAKLKEIDEMMSDPMNESLVSDDIDLGGLDLSGEDDLLAATVEEEVKKSPRKKKEESVSSSESTSSSSRSVDQDIKQIVGNYSGEMERLAATLSNLRADREELLAKIQKLEEEKILQHRQNLSLRAELDEKKIELTIIKKKLNEENNELKDRLKIQEEMKLIMEEKNRQLQLEVEKISQKNRLDVKKVQGRERELEQKLELLKADAETQIRHRDQKILELKRRIDGMEFDMESMGHQEKRSLEGKVELEQKLDKAIRTLRGAISILENDSEAAQVLEKLKKNIEV